MSRYENKDLKHENRVFIAEPVLSLKRVSPSLIHHFPEHLMSCVWGALRRISEEQNGVRASI